MTLGLSEAEVMRICTLVVLMAHPSKPKSTAKHAADTR